jgi:hypothetical protein
VNPLALPLWVGLALAKLALAIVGVVAVPFTAPTHPLWGNKTDPVPPKWYRPGQPEWLRDYVWRAWRNPVNNLRYLIDEPDWAHITGDINPDLSVREFEFKVAWRYLTSESGLFFEYWYLRRCDDGEFFEFRIGWKFGVTPGFGPTLQLRKGA